MLVCERRQGRRSGDHDVYTLIRREHTSPEQRGHAEVGDLHIILMVQQNVLGLDVAVGDSPCVQVLEPGEELTPVSARLGLAHPHVWFDAVEEFTAAGVLQEHVVQTLVHALAEAAQHVVVAQRAVQRRLARGGGGGVGRGAGAPHHLERHGGARARVHQQPHPAQCTARVTPRCRAAAAEAATAGWINFQGCAARRRRDSLASCFFSRNCSV